jgi:hypothetical protein
VSQCEQPCLAMWPLPRQGNTTLLQCVLMDNNVRRDISMTDTVTLSFFPLITPPLASIKGSVGQPLQGLDSR